jgi:hypothetical protein
MSDLTPEQILLIKSQRAQLERKALFATCVSKEHLHLWIKRYLDVDLPGTIICDDDVTHEPSNSSPMDLVWEIYSKALEGTDEGFQKVLAYAARNSYKTVACSVLEVLSIMHLGRNVAHAAAIESQAQVCAKYIEDYFRKPYLRDFLTSKNKREISITFFRHKQSGDVLNETEWTALDVAERDEYARHSNWIKILICTMGGMNSTHAPLMILDELDLAPPKPLEEAKQIPCAGPNGELPITFMTSSRKFSFGPVQKEIDRAQAEGTGLVIRHWNVLDVTQACPPTRHLPEEPRIPIYYNEGNLKAISEADWKLLSEEDQRKFFVQEGYAGCLKKCSLFAGCRGRLATKQKSKSKFLQNIAEVKSKAESASSPEFVKAQMFCWKPSTEGLVYPNFSRARHMLTAAQMAEKITGEKFQPHFTKADLIQLMINRGMEFHSGMDFGYTHNWAVVTGAKDGHRLFLFDVISQAGLELMEKIEAFKARISFLNPMVYPDPAYPSDIKTFKRWGVRCKNFVKDVLGGIESVRSKFLPGINREPELYLLANDEGCELLAKRLSTYHWKVDATEKISDIPDDDMDDECDALRYLCQNVFGNKTRFSASVSPLLEGQKIYSSPSAIPQPGVPEFYQRERIVEPTAQNFLTYKIQELLGTEAPDSGERRGKRGSFIFDL